MTLAAGTRLGPYRIEQPLGAGGMGEVYRAADTRLDRTVAIKVLPDSAVADTERKRRFTQEAKAASALNHPGIVTIHDITEVDGTTFIVMEYVHGRTLRDSIGRKGLKLDVALNYAIQTANALSRAHAIGIVHRDLKPANIMVTDDGRVKILDFGLAKLTSAGEKENEEEDDESTALGTTSAGAQLQTAAGMVVGTVAYMSPEQAEGKNVDARSDIFSFGAVLYEMVTGSRAFQASSQALTMAAVVTAEPRPPSELMKDLPRELERIIARCLRKDPSRRFQHAADLAVELEEIKTESGTQIAAARGTAPNTRTRTIVGSACVITLAAISVWLLWPKPSAPFVPPTVAHLTALPGDEQFPSLSPDGNQVAFAWNGETVNNDVYVMPVGGVTPVRLTSDPSFDTAPVWSADGKQIAFVRSDARIATQGAIFLITPPLANAEQKLADIVPVAERNNPFTTLSWHPDGTALVVAESDEDHHMNGIVAIPIDRGARRKLIWTPYTAGTYHYPTISPTGSAMAYALCADGYYCDVYAVDVGSDLGFKGAPRKLTADRAQVRGITWADDGQSLVYGLGALVRFSLWRIRATGGQPERLEIAGDHAVHPAFSRSTATLAFMRLDDDADIWRLGPNGAEIFPLSSTLDERNPQFSPDGKKIVFESRRLGKEQLWVANADGTNPAPLTDAAEGTQGSPSWSPDGRRIAFDGQGPDGQSIYVVEASGGRPRLVAAPGQIPSWSRDGKAVYFDSARSGRREVWRAPVEGGSAVQITHDGGQVALESTDGRTLYYRKGRTLVSRPLAGGPERQLASPVSGTVHPYVPVENGVYYVSRAGTSPPIELRFLDESTGTDAVLSRFDARLGTGLTVSPDRKTILYSGTRPSQGSDLMLIRNFR